MIITKQLFNKIPDGQIFATGFIEDTPEGCNMTGNGQLLRFIAKKGSNDDWCVYVHTADKSLDFIRSNGDKIQNPSNILKCVEVEESLLEQYRL